MAQVFKRFFSTDSAKAIKAQSYGYLNAINYMAPGDTSGVANICPHASPACLALCLGWFSGQAGMVKGNRKNARNSVRRSRIEKVKLFMSDRVAFMREMVAGIEQAFGAPSRWRALALKLCVRVDGSSGIAIAWLKLACVRNGVTFRNVFEAFPEAQFVDYTKNPALALMGARGQLPPNWHVTFSHSEVNEKQCLDVLRAGGNVAVVFAGEKPSTFLGYPVIDGDKHDLRHLDSKRHWRAPSS